MIETRLPVSVEPVWVSPRRRWRPPAPPVSVLCGLLVAALLIYFALSPEPAFARDPFAAALRHHLVTTAALAVWLVALICARCLPRSTPFDGPLLLLLLAQGAAMLAAADRRLALEPSLNLLAAVLLFYALVDLPGLTVAALGWALMLMAVVASLLALASVWRQWQRWLRLIHAVPGGASPLPPTVPRVANVGSHPNILAALLMLAVPLFLLALVRERGARRLLVAVALLLVETATFFTLARSAWAGQAAAIAVCVAGFSLAGRRGHASKLKTTPDAGWAVALVGEVAPPETAPTPKRRLAGWTAALRQATTRWRSRPLLVAGCMALLALVLAAALLLASGARPIWLFRASLAPRSDMRAVGLRIFVQHPLFGAGPGSYPLLYASEGGSYPNAAIHSHNVPVQIAADSGLAGLVAALLVAACAVVLLWRLWRCGDTRQRLLVAALAASLVAFGVDGMGEALELFPEVLLVLAALGAMAIRTAREREGDGRDPLLRPSRWQAAAAPALAVLLLLLAVPLCMLWLRVDLAGADYTRSVDLAAQSHWRRSAAAAGQAALIDPNLAVYHVQAAVALEQAWQAGRLPDGRNQAIAELRRSLALEPYSGPTLLDLAALLASGPCPPSAGSTQTAGTVCRGQALALLPALLQNADHDSLLLLGDAALVEQLQPAKAVETYAGLIVLDPALGATPFWRQTAFRRDHFAVIVRRALVRVNEVASGPAAQARRSAIALYAGLPGAVVPLPAGTDFSARVARGRLLTAAGKFDQAARLLQPAVAERPDDPSARQALGDLDAARGMLHAARVQWAAGAYLGDRGSLRRLNDSFPAGAVPAYLRQLGDTALLDWGLSRYYLTFQHYRFGYARREPLPIILPGGWLDALPNDYYTLKSDVAHW